MYVLCYLFFLIVRAYTKEHCIYVLLVGQLRTLQRLQRLWPFWRPQNLTGAAEEIRDKNSEAIFQKISQDPKSTWYH